MTSVVMFFVNLASWFFWKLGPKRAVALGRAIGSFVYRFLPVRRSIVLENLRHAFPEKSEAERRRIAEGCYRQLGRVLAEALFLPRLSSEEISKLVRFNGLEIADKAFAEGRGLIFCMAHMGNWELIGYEAARRGYTFYAITKRLKGKLNERLHASRKKLFHELPPSGSFHQGVEVLKSNLAVALIIDQHRASDRAVIVDFFGRPAATSPSPALFALRTGSPVVTAWMTIGPDDVYDINIKEGFDVPDAPTEAERIQRHTQLIASDLEATIRAQPEQWFWVHRRWKYAEKLEREAARSAPAQAS